MKMDRKIEVGSNSKSEADRHVHHLVPGIKSFSKYAGLAVSLIGLLVLFGWLLGIEQLKNVFAGLPAMKANTAIAFITAGLSLWLRGSTSPKIQTVVQILGAITGLIGLLTLSEYLSGRNFGIDELIFKDMAASGVLYPGRMSFMSALNFTMMGMALLLFDSDNERRYNLGQSLTLVAGIIAYVALAGHLFDVNSLYRVGVFAPMAFHTALSFILLFVGIICAQPEDGWVGNLIADTLGGDLLRRLLPVAFVAPILLGWLGLQGQLAGYYETAFGTALLTVAITLFLSLIIWFNAKGLTHVDMDRRRAEQNLRASEERYRNLFDLVPVAVYACDADGLIQEFNQRAVELWGREPKKNDPSEKFCGSFKIFYPDGRFMLHGECPMARMIGGGTLAPHELEILVERPDGLRKNVLAHPLALKNERGEIVGAINCLYDITERKQAEQASAEFAQQQEALYKLTDQLQRTNSLEDVFNAALNAILSALQCDRSSILLFDDAGVMRFVAWSGLSDGYRKATDGHSPWKPDEKNAEPIVINDIGMAELSDSLKAVIKEEGIGSLAFIPLLSNGKLIGKFMTYFNAPHVFSDGELDLSLTIANQLAFGIDRKRTEEKLHASEALYRAIAGGIPGGGVYVVDKDMRYLVAEGPVTRAFGLARDMLEGHTVSEIFSGETKENLEERFRLAFAGEIVSSEVERDGHVYWSQSAPLVDSVGEAIIVTLDVTERKQTEKALHESKERYRNLFDLVPVAVYACDANGLIQEFNHRAVELWGREPLKNDPKEKFCGSFKMFDLDGRFMLHEECHMARMLRGETLEPHELEILVERPDGMRRNVLAHPLPLKNERGEIVGAINCVYDITERKQAEEALRESEERFRAILRQATVGIVRKDAEGKLMFVNEAFCNMLGYTESELLGKTIWQLTHNDDVEENKRLYDRTMIEGIPFKLEKRLMRQDGSTLWVDVSVSPVMDATGKPQSAVAVEVDITGRKHAEEALRDLNLQLESRVQNRTVRLQESNQSLLNEIAERQKAEEALHESRKRLQILSQRLVEVQEEERRAIARELHDSVGQSLSALNINLVILDNQISNYADEQTRTRLNDSMKLTAEAITLVRDVMSNLRPSVLDDYGLEAALQSYMDQFKSRYGIKILFEKPDQPIRRLGSSIEMTFLRIAQEALLNSARHARADQVTLSLWQEENAIRLAVQDNGSGIESWQDANRPGSHGLTIMRERAEAVSGNLRVASLPGKGTKVEVSIPIENGGRHEIPEEGQE